LVGAPGIAITFTDVTAASGIKFRHVNGAFGKKYLPETLGSGCAFLDFDNDGWQDVLLINSMPWPSRQGPPSYPALYRNNHDGTFDLYVANYGQWTAEWDLYCTLDGKTKSYCTPESYKGQSATLYHNRGDGTFEDVTRKAGLYDPSSKALGVALIDVDADGWPDVFV